MSPYKVYVTPQALEEIKNLPGNVRQRLRKIIRELATQPKPDQARLLQYPLENRQLYRIRMDNWRIVYSIIDSEQIIDVLAIRRRPPYDYGDLTALLENLD